MQTNVLEYLEQTAPRVPDKVAYGNEDTEVTFVEVLRNAQAIGTFLKRQGHYKEPVVVFMRKHPNAIISFYGAVYAGCFYVPIDEEMPKHRIELTMDTLVKAFENQLDRLFASDALDVSADIDVMQNMLRADGLTDDAPFKM